MCGRFTQITPEDKVKEEFEIDEGSTFFELNYNCAPGQNIGSIVFEDEKRQLKFLKWGLVLPWSYQNNKYKLINIRSETLNQKKSFQSLFQRTRCLIFTSGFFEWQKKPEGKTPYYIYMKDNKPFVMAGLWNRFETQAKEKIESCAILTTKANDFVMPIHNRMPVIIEKEYWSLWLSIKDEPLELLKILKPYQAHLMQAHQVSSFVNNPGNNSKKCIKPNNISLF